MVLEKVNMAENNFGMRVGDGECRDTRRVISQERATTTCGRGN